MGRRLQAGIGWPFIRLLAGAWLCALAPTGRAQSFVGGIRGTVTDAEFGGPVPETRVRILETGLQRQTGDDGHFVLEDLAPGAYTVMISHEGYTRHFASSVVVSPGQFAELEVALKGEYMEMEEFVVRDLGTDDTATEVGLLNLRQASLTFRDSIGKELMQRAGASDAAGALRLVVGTSIVDGKYASVRGLSDRYVGAAVNGVRVPSADPKKRAVHMDLFPAGTIKNISVAKTFTPELSGDSSGGSVNIETIGVPDKPFFKASFSREYNRVVSGKSDFVTYDGAGVGDWGRHKGARDMAAGMSTMEEDGLTQENLASQHEQLVDREHPHDEIHERFDRIVRSVKPAMGTVRGRAGPNSGYNLSGGDRRALGTEGALGWTAAFTYSHKYYMDRIDESSLSLPVVENTTGTNHNTYGRDTGTEELKWSEMAAIGLTKGADHDVTLSLMNNRTATDRASVRVEDHELTDVDWEQSQSIHYTERSLTMLQLKGSHLWKKGFGDRMGLELDWFGVHNRTEQEEPDVRYFKNMVVGRDDYWQYQPRSDGASGADQDSSVRIWRNTKEDNSQYGLNLAIPFRARAADLNAGFVKDRDITWIESEGRLRFGFLRDFTLRDFRQNAFFYTMGGQQGPLYTGPTRSDFPRGAAGAAQYAAAQAAWLEGPAGQAYAKGQEDTAADAALATHTNVSPDALWTDVFTDADRIGTSRYQNSMLWYLLPKAGDVSYRGSQTFRSGYLSLDYPLTRQLTFLYGGRLEGTQMTVAPRSDLEFSNPENAFLVPVKNYVTNSAGEVIYYYTLDGVPREEATAEIDEAEWLRAAGLTLELAPTMKARFNWSRTIARPTFLELAPVITYDYIDRESFIGNRDLKISHVENVDLRWEWFPKGGAVLGASWFKKRIDDPIERESFAYLSEDYLLAVNYPYGEVQGYELEARHPLDFVAEALKNFTLGANYTAMESFVVVPEAQADSLRQFGIDRDRRTMVGTPNQLFNLNLTYEHPTWGTSAGLFYTFTGDLLKSGAAIGTDGATPDVYTKSYANLNLSFSQKIGKYWTFSAGIRNMLDQPVREVYRMQDADGRDVDIDRRRYKPGLVYTVGVGCSF